MTEFIALRPKMYAYKKLNERLQKDVKELRGVWWKSVSHLRIM